MVTLSFKEDCGLDVVAKCPLHQNGKERFLFKYGGHIHQISDDLFEDSFILDGEIDRKTSKDISEELVRIGVLKEETFELNSDIEITQKTFDDKPIESKSKLISTHKAHVLNILMDKQNQDYGFVSQRDLESQKYDISKDEACEIREHLKKENVLTPSSRILEKNQTTQQVKLKMFYDEDGGDLDKINYITSVLKAIAAPNPKVLKTCCTARFRKVGSRLVVTTQIEEIKEGDSLTLRYANGFKAQNSSVASTSNNQTPLQSLVAAGAAASGSLDSDPEGKQPDLKIQKAQSLGLTHVPGQTATSQDQPPNPQSQLQHFPFATPQLQPQQKRRQVEKFTVIQNYINNNKEKVKKRFLNARTLFPSTYAKIMVDENGTPCDEQNGGPSVGYYHKISLLLHNERRSIKSIISGDKARAQSDEALKRYWQVLKLFQEKYTELIREQKPSLTLDDLSKEVFECLSKDFLHKRYKKTKAKVGRSGGIHRNGASRPSRRIGEKRSEFKSTFICKK